MRLVFLHIIVFKIKILKGIPIKVEIRTALSESKIWLFYQQTFYYISELQKVYNLTPKYKKIESFYSLLVIS